MKYENIFKVILICCALKFKAWKSPHIFMLIMYTYLAYLAYFSNTLQQQLVKYSHTWVVKA